VLVTHGFLKSLSRLDLEESAVGRFARRPVRSVTMSDAPWTAVAAIVAGLATAVFALLRLRR
jgi:hypothetical protein